ncbi:hypothetical protein, partial [Streptomyces niveiscabiei]|uniref:hypothetical protein n=1 Tax=Streptomyces niveiscabiei TaxID=164115 RepID=UPI0038F6625D
EALAREPGRPRDVLARLQQRTDQAQTIDSTFLRVPVSSWVAAGMRDELNNQRIRGNAVLSQQLEEPDRSTWLAAADLTPEAAAELWEG